VHVRTSELEHRSAPWVIVPRQAAGGLLLPHGLRSLRAVRVDDGGRAAMPLPTAILGRGAFNIHDDDEVVAVLLRIAPHALRGCALTPVPRGTAEQGDFETAWRKTDSLYLITAPPGSGSGLVSRPSAVVGELAMAVAASTDGWLFVERPRFPQTSSVRTSVRTSAARLCVASTHHETFPDPATWSSAQANHHTLACSHHTDTRQAVR
jgi:hypothetical protein